MTTELSSSEVGVPRSQISLRSVEDSNRWFEILSQNPEGPSTIFSLHISGAESLPSLLTWPKLKNLHHLELRGIDLRDSHASFKTFSGIYSSSIDGLVLEGVRFRGADGLFAFIAPFKNLVSLIIHDVEWGEGGLDDEAEFDSESESEDETHKHTTQPGDCCAAAVPGHHLTDDKGIDLPALKHLSLRGCSSTITRPLTRMASKLLLSRLEISWEEEHLLPLGEIIEACAPSLSELSISGVFNTECDYPLSLLPCIHLTSLYLNGIHLFIGEPLGPALHNLASTLPTAKESEYPRSVNAGFALDVGPAWESRIDDIDWDAAEVALASLESRVGDGRDHWNVTVKVDSSYPSISQDEERRVLDVARQKLSRFSTVLQLDIC